ncbi:MAG: phosphoesterase [Desulfobacteraceae bacterium 4572_89]|nr:MAG: phosphoesterase [Desulfobacteraceae bacterium 4572_89]
MNKKEKILCIHRDRLPGSWVAEKSIVPMDLGKFIEQCTLSGFEFVNRFEAENDSTLKQVIPYIVLQTHDLERTAIYNRQGSEERLHDLWSLGIGGHINPVDQQNQQSSFKDILMSGMERELEEELFKRPDQDMAEFSGIISEDITSVGKVHLGAVFRILTKTPGAYSPGPELSMFQWTNTSDLIQLNMELWSELALELISS